MEGNEEVHGVHKSNKTGQDKFNRGRNKERNEERQREEIPLAMKVCHKCGNKHLRKEPVGQMETQL